MFVIRVCEKIIGGEENYKFSAKIRKNSTLIGILLNKIEISRYYLAKPFTLPLFSV